jgi:hypothetical protein
MTTPNKHLPPLSQIFECVYARDGSENIGAAAPISAPLLERSLTTEGQAHEGIVNQWLVRRDLT